MKSSDSPSAAPGRWTSLWILALLSLLAQLALCQFFSFGGSVPVSLDVNPSNLWKLAYHFPPTGSFEVLNWLGVAFLPQPLNPLSFAAACLPPWWFFTIYAPLMGTLALLAMAAFLRELELPRPAALFGGVIFAWQGDILSFVYPGHYAYMATWPFFAIAAWGALRAERTRYWAYPVISGACCGLMVGLQPDRGGIASLLIATLYLAPIFRRSAAGRMAADYLEPLRHLLLCVSVAAIIALAPLLALFQSYIVGVKMAGVADRAQTYKLVTQFSIGPAETLTYLVPGFFGWHINNPDGPYWGWVGEWPDWPKNHQGMRNLTLALSTTGTVATVLALIGVGLLLPRRLLGPDRLTERQRFYGRVLLGLGFITLILAWGWHTPLYRPLFALPLMDKWRNPLKWLEMTNFALVVLSAIGVQQVMASLEAEALVIVRRRLIWFTHGILALLGVGLLVSYPLAVIFAATFQRDGYEPLAVANIMSTMHTSLLVALGVMALFCLLLHALWQPDKLRGWTPVNPWLHRLWQLMLRPDYLPLTLALGLAALAVVQLGWVANQFIQPIPIVALTATNPLLEALRSEGNTVRVAVPTDDPMLKDNLLQNQFAAPNMNISCLDVSAASRIPDDLNAFLQALDNDEARLWFLAGVKNVAVPQQAVSQMRLDPGLEANIGHADGYTLEQTGSPDMPSHALVGMKDYLAKATLVPQAEFFTTDEALLKRLKDPAWNPRASVLLNPGHKLSKFSEKTGGTSALDKIDLKTYTPTEIEIEAHSVHGGFVLINDQYDPDWEVQVNGHDVELLRADYIMRAVEVPPGESTVTMHYVAHYHVGGLSLPAQTMNNLSDGAMLAAWLIAGFAIWRKRPRTAADF